jgi:hypothetical protein
MRLLSELGQDSRWAKAMYDDPEMADEMAASALKNAGKKWRPSNADWGLLNEQLATMIDLQQQHLRMLSSTPNKTLLPYPRPETEFTKALELLKEQQAESELARVYDFVAEGQRRWREGHRPAPYDPEA